MYIKFNVPVPRRHGFLDNHREPLLDLIVGRWAIVLVLALQSNVSIVLQSKEVLLLSVYSLT